MNNQQQTGTRYRKAIFITVVLVLFLILLGTVLFIMGNNKQKTENQDPDRLQERVDDVFGEEQIDNEQIKAQLEKMWDTSTQATPDKKAPSVVSPEPTQSRINALFITTQ